MFKICSRCGEAKDLELFTKSTNTKDKRRSHCKECNNLYYRQRRKDQWEKVRSYEKKFHRARSLWYNYKLTEDDYSRMLTEQEGRCAVCKSLPEKQRLAVDHNHTTGQVRGLLCSKCNKGLGLFQDSQELLEKAATYLNNRHK